MKAAQAKSQARTGKLEVLFHIDACHNSRPAPMFFAMGLQWFYYDPWSRHPWGELWSPRTAISEAIKAWTDLCRNNFNEWAAPSIYADPF
jgi:hypothetical protein